MHEATQYKITPDCIRIRRGAGIPPPDVHQGRPSEIRAVHGCDRLQQGRDNPSEHSELADVALIAMVI